MHDATGRFNPKGFERLIVPEWKSREKLVSMRIDDFLLLAEPGISDIKTQGVEEILQQGKVFATLPYLLAYRDSSGQLKVEGHEGRHRARALKAAGFQSMPVVLKTDIRWSEQDSPAKIDYCAEWPEWILAETGQQRIPMPVSRDDATKPYPFKPGQVDALLAHIEVDGVLRPTRNSIGQAIHPTIDGVCNFWRWFEDRKMVDDQGRPLVVYHGTASDFDAFKPSHRGSFGSGIYFSADASVADAFSGDGEAHLIIPAYISLRRPYLARADYEAGEALDIDAPWIPMAQDILDPKDFQRVLRESAASDGLLGDLIRDTLMECGHDGIVATYPDGSTEIVVFLPDQIKSALGNSGTFTPESASLTDASPDALECDQDDSAIMLASM